MHFSRYAFGLECLEPQFHASARGQHGVGNDESFAVQVRRGQIFDMYAHFVAFFVFVEAVGRHECVVGLLKHIQEALMEREAGPEDGSQYDRVVVQQRRRRAQRGLYVFDGIIQRFTDFVSHYFPDSFQIAAEPRPVFLYAYVPEFRHVSVDNRLLLCKVNYFHIWMDLNILENKSNKNFLKM